MEYRPLSFTKNLGGYSTLYAAIRQNYRPRITVKEFLSSLPAQVKGRGLVISEFFLATQIVNGIEEIYEDALIRETLRRPLDLPLKRLYLFALLLNMPGQRHDASLRSPAAAQNSFVRTHLHDGHGWVASRLELSREMLPWFESRMSMNPGALKKFCTNFRYFFEQCALSTTQSGHLDTNAAYWLPQAMRLFSERSSITIPAANTTSVQQLAVQYDIHKLCGTNEAALTSYFT